MVLALDVHRLVLVAVAVNLHALVVLPPLDTPTSSIAVVWPVAPMDTTASQLQVNALSANLPV